MQMRISRERRREYVLKAKLDTWLDIKSISMCKFVPDYIEWAARYVSKCPYLYGSLHLVQAEV